MKKLGFGAMRLPLIDPQDKSSIDIMTIDVSIIPKYALTSSIVVIKRVGKHNNNLLRYN